jgi:hypothetical protein
MRYVDKLTMCISSYIVCNNIALSNSCVAFLDVV